MIIDDIHITSLVFKYICIVGIFFIKILIVLVVLLFLVSKSRRTKLLPTYLLLHGVILLLQELDVIKHLLVLLLQHLNLLLGLRVTLIQLFRYVLQLLYPHLVAANLVVLVLQQNLSVVLVLFAL